MFYATVCGCGYYNVQESLDEKKICGFCKEEVEGVNPIPMTADEIEELLNSREE